MTVVKAVLDTNILISALLFGGIPRDILLLALKKDILAVTSPVLLAELGDILSKKFMFSQSKVAIVEKKLKKSFFVVYPNREIHVLKDEPDNRVLEAAIEGRCNAIVTGDKELLQLKTFEDVVIVTANQFLLMR